MTPFTEVLNILERTPLVLQAQLNNLPPRYTLHNEGPGTWTVPEVLAHLIFADVHNWIPRIKLILHSAQTPVFTTFDGSNQFTNIQATDALISRFIQARTVALQQLQAFAIEPKDLDKKALHPALGEVTLSQLLATWATHDLAHTAQIVRIMAKQNTHAVGPWTSYLTILHDRKQ